MFLQISGFCVQLHVVSTKRNIVNEEISCLCSFWMTMVRSSVKVHSTKRALAQTVFFFFIIIRSAISESFDNISFNFTSFQTSDPNITYQGNASTLNSAMELSIVPAGQSGNEIVGRALIINLCTCGIAWQGMWQISPVDLLLPSILRNTQNLLMDWLSFSPPTDHRFLKAR